MAIFKLTIPEVTLQQPELNDLNLACYRALRATYDDSAELDDILKIAMKEVLFGLQQIGLRQRAAAARAAEREGARARKAGA